MQMLTAHPNGVRSAERELILDPVTGLAYPASPFMKYLYKTPVLLWRLGLGPLLGRTIMLMTTTGRKSGQPRRTPIEYNVYNGRKYVLSGWGENADWYKNMLADPHVTIQTASGAESVIARRVTDQAELNDAYNAVENSRTIQGLLDMLNVSVTREQFVQETDKFYVVTFDPTDEQTPPPLKADLAWVWSAIGNIVVGLVIARIIRRKRGKSRKA